MTNYGDTRHGRWLMEFVQLSFGDAGPTRQVAHVQVMVRMCRDEPASALTALRMMSSKLKLLLGPASEEEGAFEKADASTRATVFTVGWLFLAYGASRGMRDEAIPEEVWPIVMDYPPLVMCGEYVKEKFHATSADFQGSG